MPIRFKFREDAKPGERKRILDRLKKLGAESVTPMFPDDDDPELASMYKADCDDAKIVKALEKDASIEFAERDARRKLIR